MGKANKTYLYIAIVVILLVMLFVFMSKNTNREIYSEKEIKSLGEIDALENEIDSLGATLSELDGEIDITS